MTSWGYARLSTVDQDTAPQFDALRRAGIDDAHIVTDHASGTREDRPGLVQLLEQLQPGDVLTVWKLDRLGRSLAHLISLVDELGKRGVEFRSLTDALDTMTPGGRLMFHIVGAVAQFAGDHGRADEGGAGAGEAQWPAAGAAEPGQSGAVRADSPATRRGQVPRRHRQEHRAQAGRGGSGASGRDRLARPLHTRR